MAPNNQLAAGARGPTTANNVNFSGTTPAALRDAMYAMLPQITKATRAAMIHTAGEATVSSGLRVMRSNTRAEK